MNSRNRIRLLVADSEIDSLQIYQEYGEILGWDVSVSADGESAYALSCRQTLDSVLLNAPLPGIDVLDLLDRMRAPDHPNCQTPVAVTGLKPQGFVTGIPDEKNAFIAPVKPVFLTDFKILILKTARHRDIADVPAEKWCM